MSIRFFLSVLGLSAAGLLSLSAQNLVPNGTFQSYTTDDDLWDGVDGDGILAGTIRTLTGLNDANHPAEVATPLSVAVGDLNGDGLPDLMTADTLGYFRVYFNSGTKTEPKFTHAEIIPMFVSRPLPPPGNARGTGPTREAVMSSRGPRIDLYDMQRRGSLDIVAGFYGGDMMLIPNAGSRTAPLYRQVSNPASLLFPTSDRNLKWANLLAPTVVDWNKDGRPDLLIGDGSYSANSIFLLLNQGSGTQPKFGESTRSYLVYGNGRTQLTPTVADYNGDGLPDVIVSDRTGKVTVNLNQANAKLGETLEKSSVITFGGSDSLRQGVTVKAADLNGDGLFDLVFGKANGRIAMALNKGTKEQPQFGPVEDVRGEDVYRRDILTPSNWSYDGGLEKGNFLSRVSVVTAATDSAAMPPTGKSCLRLSYDQPLNKVMQFLPPVSRGSDPKTASYYSDFFHMIAPADGANRDLPPTSIMLKVELQSVLPGTPYEFSFNCKGRNCTGDYSLVMTGRGDRSERKITKGDRGSASVQQDVAVDDDLEQGTFAATPEWKTITRSVTFEFTKNRELNDYKKWKGIGKPSYSGAIFLRVDVAPYDGVFYLDNVQLQPKH